MCREVETEHALSLQTHLKKFKYLDIGVMALPVAGLLAEARGARMALEGRGGEDIGGPAQGKHRRYAPGRHSPFPQVSLAFLGCR